MMDMPKVSATSIKIEGRTEPLNLKMMSCKDESTHNRKLRTEGLLWNLGAVQGSLTGNE